jgi:hypothetical protein
VTGLRRHSTWLGPPAPECCAIHRRPVTRASGPEDPGARLGRLFDSPLGCCEGRLQVGSYFGHDLLGAADLRLPAAFAAGATLVAFGSGRRPDGDLVPGDLLINGDGHGHLQSVGDGRTYPLGKPVAKLPAWVGHAVCRGRLGQAKAGGGADRSARRVRRRVVAVAKVGERRKVSSPPGNRSSKNATQFC